MGRKYGNCSLSRPGVGRRSALYVSATSSRSTGRVSHATATPFGL